MLNDILSADAEKPNGQEDVNSDYLVDEIRVQNQTRTIKSYIKFDEKKTTYTKKFPIIAGSLFVVIVIFFGWFFFFKTHHETLTAQSGSWERKIGVESYEPRHRSGWSYPPRDAYNVESDYRFHYTREVLDHYDMESYSCGSSDRSQTCTRSNPVYRTEPVYDWHYSYTIDRWEFKRWIISSGDKSTIPYWTDVSKEPFNNTNVIGNERLSGEKKEDYDIYLTNESGEKKHLDVNLDIWLHVVIGQSYDAEVSRVGIVRSVDWGV